MVEIEVGKENLNELVQKIKEESCKKMLVIYGNCLAIFDGRIKSFLPEGDRILIIKKDESLILHGSKGVKPLNWQLPGAGKINFLIENNQLVVRTHRPKTREDLEIVFEKIYHTTFYDAHDCASLSIYGSESDLSNYLFNHPEIISNDFQPTAREFETPFGFLDLRGVDKEGNIIIIEVKKRNAVPQDAHQLKRYVEYFEKVEKITVKGILVAQGFSSKVLNVLQTNNLEAVEVPWQEIFPAISNEKPKITIEDFFSEEK
ncbi:MAG TPA: endonuclease NucS domain-containing protein [candidate division Zixibacteria bacterium]|nr:endonuclease NucS domain-containing protein [candidate division Zixibacteria bacterium]